MSDQESVESSKRRAAEQAQNNHQVGVDGDDPSNADRRDGLVSPGRSGPHHTDPAQVQQNIEPENPSG